MASVPFYNYSKQVSSPSPYPTSEKIRNRSKAQMRLERILEIISSRSRDSSRGSFPSTNRPFLRSESEVEGRKVAPACSFDGIEIDLNLRLGPVSEIQGSENPTAKGGFSACSGVGKSDGCNSFPESGEVSTVEKSFQGECDPKTENREEEARDVSKITNPQEETSRDSKEVENRVEEAGNGEESDSKPIISCKEEEEENGQNKAEHRNEGYLNLLLEAVRQISGDFEDEPQMKEPEPEPEPKPKPEPVRCCRSKRKSCCCWMIDFYGGFEDIAPVVRSKRGRNQVLPYRYRDSILEPWKRLTR